MVDLQVSTFNLAMVERVRTGSVARGGARSMARWAGIALALLAWLAACGPGEVAAPPPPEVLFVPVVARDVPVTNEWLGTTEGYVDAQIRSQVAGYLISRDYQE